MAQNINNNRFDTEGFCASEIAFWIARTNPGSFVFKLIVIHLLLSSDIIKATRITFLGG